MQDDRLPNVFDNSQRTPIQPRREGQLDPRQFRPQQPEARQDYGASSHEQERRNFDPFAGLAPIRRHKENPNCYHLRDFIDDVVSVFEDMQNHYVQLLEKHVSAITDRLTATVQELTTAVGNHDTAIQAAIANLKDAQASGDDTAMNAAIEAISSASAKIAEETKNINDKLQTQTLIGDGGNGGANQPVPDAPAPAAANDGTVQQ
jgi:hypothetical protein